MMMVKYISGIYTLILDMHLNNIGKYIFLENIVSLSSLYLKDIDVYALVIAFKDAKFSIVGFDSATCALKTLSLHNFETDDFKAGYFTTFYIPKTSVDPSSQCAIMSFYNSYLAVLPLSNTYDSSQDEIFNSNDQDLGNSEIMNEKLAQKPSLKMFKLPSSFVINIKDITMKFTNVLDFQFLHGYYEPTLAILYEPFQSWPGKVTTRQETVCLITISINLYQRVFPIIWSMTNLPYDSLRIVPVPRPLGGLMLLASNSILYLNQRATAPICSLALNSLAQPNLHRVPALGDGYVFPPLTLSPGSVRAVFLDPTRAMVSTNGVGCGRYIVVTLDKHQGTAGSAIGDPHSPVFSPYSYPTSQDLPSHVTDDLSDLQRIHYKLTGGVSADMRLRFRVSLLDTFPPPYGYVQATDMCHCGDNLVFIASHTSDSLLVKIEPRYELPSSVLMSIDHPPIEMISTNDVKLQANGDESIMETSNVSDDIKPDFPFPNVSMGMVNKDDSFLSGKDEPLDGGKEGEKGDVGRTYKIPNAAYKFVVSDSLLNIGPCAQSTLSQPFLSSTEDFGISDPLSIPDLELVVASGRGVNGALTVLQKSIMPQLITTFHLPGVVNMWTLNQSPHLASHDGNDLFNDDRAEGYGEFNSYLILSMQDSTLVLKTGQEITEMESSGFNTQAPTLLAGNVVGSDGRVYIVQVTPTSARLLIGDKQIQHMTLDVAGVLGLPLVSAHLVDHLILLLGESSQVNLLTLNDKYQSSDHECHARLQVIHGSSGKIHSKPPIVAACLYKDDSGLFTYDTATNSYFVRPRYGTQSQSTLETPTVKVQRKMVDRSNVMDGNISNIDGNIGVASSGTDLQPILKKIKVEAISSLKDLPIDEVDELLYGESLLSTDLVEGVKQIDGSSLQTTERALDISKKDDILENSKEIQPLSSAKNEDIDPFSTYMVSTNDLNRFTDDGVEAPTGPMYIRLGKRKAETPTYWAAVARVNGSLEIYSLPLLRLVYRARNLHLKRDILTDELILAGVGKRAQDFRETGLGLDQDDDTKQNLLDTYSIKEIAMVSLCPSLTNAHEPGETMALDGHSGLDTMNDLLHSGPGPFVASDEHPTLLDTPRRPPKKVAYPKPYLLAIVNDLLLLYEIYPYQNENNISPENLPLNPDVPGDGHIEKGGSLIPTLCDDIIRGTAHKRLNIRFRKIHHNMLLGERKAAKSLPKKESFYKLFNVLRTTPIVRPFKDINGNSGVFIQGLYPHWIIPGTHGDLKIHPMSIDGPVYAFTPFHNVNCQRGFLYFNHKEDLRVGTLLPHLRYDEDWLVRKVPIGRTVHFVEYHIKMKVYVVVTSERLAARRVVKNLNLNMAAFSAVNMGAAVVLPSANPSLIGAGMASGTAPGTEPEDEREFEEVDPDPTFPAPPEDRFYVDLVAPATWELVPSARLNFAAEWERVTCFQQVSLASQVTMTGFKDLIVMGTACVYGEDMTCRGRLIILDIIEVVPEPGKPMTRYKIKTLCATEQKGPLVALGSVSGNLVTVIGQKIYVWMLNNNNDLVGLAFIDTSLCVHRMVTVKNLIIVGDLHKSITLLRYDPHSKTISVASRELSHLSVYGIQFLVDNEKLAFLATDHNKNMAIFMYQPQNRDSFGGQRLVRKGDIHVGKNISSLFRIFCKRRDPTSDKKPSLALERRQVTFFLGLDGSIGYMLPINEKIYRRLLMLQNFMDANLFYNAGLNPKSSRAFKPTRQQLMNPARNILDGNLLFDFMNMNALQQELITKNVGTSLDQIMDDLMEIDRTTNHF